ncbi:MAG: hypothetical protein LBF60_10305 [Treponema sp.]|jgi:hypothetical protein|nr:hypothetical protein [Treponema sp.]
MKKFFIALLAFALIAGNAFAEFSTGFWGRADFVPLQLKADGYTDDSDDSTTGAFSSIWGVTAELEGYFAWSGEKIGAVANFAFFTPAIAGLGYLWWKPIDQFKLDIGAARWAALRGPDTVDSFQGFTGLGVGDTEKIFPRFDTNTGNTPTKGGAILEITPIPNLFIGAAIVNGTRGALKDENGTEITPAPPVPELADVYKASQYAVGYNIDGIGLVRAGYFGTMAALPESIVAAFKLTAVEALGLDLGFTYSTNEAITDAKKNNILIGLAVNYSIGETGVVNFYTNAKFGGDGDVAGGEHPHLGVYLNPEINVGFANVGLGAGLETSLGADNSSKFGGDLYLAKAVGGSVIKGGLAVALAPDTAKPENLDITFSLPIQITASIW